MTDDGHGLVVRVTRADIRRCIDRGEPVTSIARRLGVSEETIRALDR